MAHKRRKQQPCAPCKAAWATYYRDYRAGLKRKKAKANDLPPTNP